MNFNLIFVAQLLTLLKAVCSVDCIDSSVSQNMLYFLIVSVHCSKYRFHFAPAQQTHTLQEENRRKGRNSHQCIANAFLCICGTKVIV